MTDYMVLKRNGEESWVTAKLAPSARSARSAIKAVVDQDGPGEYVAVPYRSWKPVTVKVETKTALTFS